MSECAEYLVKVVRAVGFNPDDDGPHAVLCAVADMVERLGADVEYSDVTAALRTLTGRDMDDADATFLRQASAGFAAGATWGAEWALAGMAVCEFLSDLAGIVAESNACPVCDAGWVRPNTVGERGRLCNSSRGPGRRVPP